ncbi:MAG TPA: sterol desaturase family protein, partial [Parafilimonas sp.]
MKNLFDKLINIDQNMLMVILLTIFYTAEQLLNKPFQFKKQSLHFLHGIPLQLGYMAVAYALAFVQVTSIQWLNAHHVGLLYQIQIPFYIKLIAGLLCIDFVIYLVHRLQHTVPLLWRLHRVHHSDTNVDTSTFFRFHPFDAIIDNAFPIISSAIFGIDIRIVVFFFLINVILTILQHTRFVYPRWVDASFGKIFVVPNFHKVHHHQNQFYTDSNFGFIFIFWDKIFGTFKYQPVQQIKYGLEEFDEQKKQSFWYLLKSPFLNIKRITAKE